MSTRDTGRRFSFGKASLTLCDCGPAGRLYRKLAEPTTTAWRSPDASGSRNLHNSRYVNPVFRSILLVSFHNRTSAVERKYSEPQDRFRYPQITPAFQSDGWRVNLYWVLRGLRH